MTTLGAPGLLGGPSSGDDATPKRGGGMNSKSGVQRTTSAGPTAKAGLVGGQGKQQGGPISPGTRPTRENQR